MKTASHIAPWMFVMVVAAAGCASTESTMRQEYTGGRIARPDRILVHAFAASPADVPAGSRVAGAYAQPTTPQTAQDIALGRKLGARLADELVTEIRAMGLPAVLAAGQPAARAGDIAIMGYFESVDTGSATRRIVLGFGSGAAHLKTAVEGYVMTKNGLQRLESGVVDSAGGKAPGVAIPLAVAIASGNPIGLAVSSAMKVEGEVSGRTTIEGAEKRTAKEIADQLRVTFQREGWI